MTRELHTHKVHPGNAELTITVKDEPGSGGANHLYMIEGFNTAGNKSDPFTERYDAPAKHATVLFQNGPIATHGVNGVTHEALIAIVIDRLACFQAGPFACRENALALTNLEQSLMWLQKRTRDRLQRGVEGTNNL